MWVISNKKGLFDVFYIIIIVFIVAILGILFSTLAYKVTKIYQETNLLQDAPVAIEANELIQSNSRSVADEFVFFMFLFGNIAIMISASRTGFSPTVIFIFIFMILFAVLIASGMVNIYQGFSQDPSLAETGNAMFLTGIIFSKYFPLFTCIISAIVLMIMYSKTGSDIIA